MVWPADMVRFALRLLVMLKHAPNMSSALLSLVIIQSVRSKTCHVAVCADFPACSSAEPNSTYPKKPSAEHHAPICPTASCHLPFCTGSPTCTRASPYAFVSGHSAENRQINCPTVANSSTPLHCGPGPYCTVHTCPLWGCDDSLICGRVKTNPNVLENPPHKRQTEYVGSSKDWPSKDTIKREADNEVTHPCSEICDEEVSSSRLFSKLSSLILSKGRCGCQAFGGILSSSEA